MSIFGYFKKFKDSAQTRMMFFFFIHPTPHPPILDGHLVLGRFAFLNSGYPRPKILEQHLGSLLMLEHVSVVCL